MDSAKLLPANEHNQTPAEWVNTPQGLRRVASKSPMLRLPSSSDETNSTAADDQTSDAEGLDAEDSYTSDTDSLFEEPAPRDGLPVNTPAAGPICFIPIPKDFHTGPPADCCSRLRDQPNPRFANLPPDHPDYDPRPLKDYTGLPGWPPRPEFGVPDEGIETAQYTVIVPDLFPYPWHPMQNPGYETFRELDLWSFDCAWGNCGSIETVDPKSRPRSEDEDGDGKEDEDERPRQRRRVEEDVAPEDDEDVALGLCSIRCSRI